jgi:hypothetical protein
MKDRLLLLVAVLVPLASGAWAPARAGVDRCCPHRVTRVGIVRTGGIAGTPPAGAGVSVPVAEPCDACDDWEVCARELEGVGASMQVMPLRNGAMRVFTASTPVGVRVVQISLARHFERMTALIAAGDGARLCTDCRIMRGAAASGKLSREIIRIDGGCIALTTSNDPAIVARIHAETGLVAPPSAPKP